MSEETKAIIAAMVCVMLVALSGMATCSYIAGHCIAAGGSWDGGTTDCVMSRKGAPN